MCYIGGLIALDFSFGNLGCGKVTESAQEPESEHICWVKNAVVACGGSADTCCAGVVFLSFQKRELN